MTIVTISRGTYTKGKEVAEILAQELNYECLSREIIIEASEEFNIPEIKLVRAIHDAPSILDRFTYGRERYLAFIKAAFLKHLQRDNIIYHGLAGHVFVQDISHVIKIRITADLEFRIQEEMKRENISREQARSIIVKDDAERNKWTMSVFDADISDPGFYDIILHIDTMGVKEAVSIIRHAIALPCFKSTPKSRRRLGDLCLASQVEAALISDFPKVTASASNGNVFVNIRGSLIDEKTVSEKVCRMLENLEGIDKIHVNMIPYVIED